MRFSTRVTLDGPLAGGAVTGLTLPIDGHVAAGGALEIDTRCTPLAFTTLALAGARFAGSSLMLCPLGGALLTRDRDGRIGGGALIDALRLAGRIGDAPVALSAGRIAFDLAGGRFVARALLAQLGPASAQTRLAVGRLEGASGVTGLAGRFAEASGQIARVPLRIGGAAGDWRLSGGTLTLAGGLGLADAASQPRFAPLAAHDARLTLAGGAIHAAATLIAPGSGRRVTQVALSHDLPSGRGAATLDVPGLSFDKGFQPEMLTPLTLGLVADVDGTVAGRGRIIWGPQGVTSSGDFHTSKLALAAPFGPVSGITGSIHFSDLLGLATTPGQEVTLGAVNPGIAVYGGHVRYQLLTDRQVRIEGGSWPLSGGTLTLEPTTLDFARSVPRRFTFRVAHLDAGQFIEQFKLDNIAATGTFDGVLPMIFDDKGGRITGGRLIARAPGGRLSYVGDVSNAQLGTFGTLAFDALKSIRYSSLAIDLDGALDGEVVSRIAFTGINEAPVTAKPAKGLARNFTGLPFRFNIVVRAPFRGLLNSAADFADPQALVRRQAVQPQESGAVRSSP